MTSKKKCSPPPGYVLRKASNTRQKMLNALLKPHNLTHAQFIMLAYTFHHAEGECKTELNQAMVAQEAQIEAMSASSLLRTLEKKGLILREKSQLDKRSHNIKITQKGKTLFNKIKQKVYEQDQQFFSSVVNRDLFIDSLQGLYQ